MQAPQKAKMSPMTQGQLSQSGLRILNRIPRIQGMRTLNHIGFAYLHNPLVV